MCSVSATICVLGSTLLVGILLAIVCMILEDLRMQRNFDAFIVRHNKSYAMDAVPSFSPGNHSKSTAPARDESYGEFYKRFRNFEESMDRIEALNAKRTHSESAVYGVTQFADMTRDEFAASMLTKRKNQKVLRPKAVPLIALLQRSQRALSDVRPLPEAFSWLDEGRLTAVRNQGRCGACWAHSVIATVESMLAIQTNRTGPVRQLSVQQMVDCANSNRGCAGGDTCNLLQWLLLNDVPIASEQSYPSTGVQLPCSADRARRAIDPVRVRSFTCENLVGREERILEYLANVGPITVGVNAVSWQYYLGGVIQHHCDGSSALLNHAVQIVGYDRRGELPYYLVRNSWGEHFGHDGYARILIGENVCGIATQVSAIMVEV